MPRHRGISKTTIAIKAPEDSDWDFLIPDSIFKHKGSFQFCPFLLYSFFLLQPTPAPTPPTKTASLQSISLSPRTRKHNRSTLACPRMNGEG